jgi:hypothetical protein
MLSQEEKTDLLRDFPNVKLSYEKIIHKKVYNGDLLLGIPDGKKCFAWFTFFKDQMLCIILEIDDKNQKEIKHIKVATSCFSTSLCYGTLFFGTLFYHMNNPFFTIEDIHLYKGNDMSNLNFNYKINKISHILKNEIKQISYNNYFVVFGLPIIGKSNEEFDKKLTTISYKLSSVRYINFSEKKSYYTLSLEEFNLCKENVIVKENVKDNKEYGKVDIVPKPMMKLEKQPFTRKDKIFICKPDIQNDIYHLYSLENEYAGLACIPDYKTSVMMNKLFRVIKENNDLDALEESDDEEEFENENIDKFVYLDKSYKMIFNFNNKFKKWVPIKIT